MSIPGWNPNGSAPGVPGGIPGQGTGLPVGGTGTGGGLGNGWSINNLLDGPNAHSGSYLAQNNGITAYQPTAAPNINGDFGGFQAAQGQGQAGMVQGQQINTQGSQPYAQAQQALLAQMQQQAQGQGPSLAQQQLRQATQANLASQMASASGLQGGQNPGLAGAQLASQAAQTNQAAAGQSALARGAEQLASQQAAGGLAQQGFQDQSTLAQNQAEMNQQANLANQAGYNQLLGQGVGNQQQASMFGAQAQQNMAGLQSQQWQEGNQLGLGASNAYNSADLALTLQNQGNQNSFTNSMISGATNAASGALAAAADGAVLTRPTNLLAGEAGPELVLPTTAPHLDKFLASLRETAQKSPEMKPDILRALKAATAAMKGSKGATSDA